MKIRISLDKSLVAGSKLKTMLVMLVAERIRQTKLNLFDNVINLIQKDKNNNCPYTRGKLNSDDMAFSERHPNFYTSGEPHGCTKEVRGKRLFLKCKIHLYSIKNSVFFSRHKRSNISCATSSLPSYTGTAKSFDQKIWLNSSGLR